MTQDDLNSDLLDAWVESGQADIDLKEAAETSKRTIEKLKESRRLDWRVLEEFITI